MCSLITLEVVKVLTKIGRESGCSSVLEWIQPCANHLYWSATTTFSGNGLVIWAKFKSFFGHVTNKHTNLPDKLFEKCAHEANIQDRKWLKEGKLGLKMISLDKLNRSTVCCLKHTQMGTFSHKELQSSASCN